MKWIVFLLIFLASPYLAAASLCDVSISIASDKQIFENKDKVEFYSRVNDSLHIYVIEYWIEDENGNILKKKRNTTSQAKKSFTPKNISRDIIIKSRISYLGCEDAGKSDNFAEKRVLFSGSNGKIPEKGVVVSFEVDKNSEKLAKFSVTLNKNKEKSQNKEIIRLVPYFLLALTTIISIILIWKR